MFWCIRNVTRWLTDEDLVYFFCLLVFFFCKNQPLSECRGHDFSFMAKNAVWCDVVFLFMFFHSACVFKCPVLFIVCCRVATRIAKRIEQLENLPMTIAEDLKMQAVTELRALRLLNFQKQVLMPFAVLNFSERIIFGWHWVLCPWKGPFGILLSSYEISKIKFFTATM